MIDMVPDIEFRNVTKHFPGAENPTLDGVNLKVYPQKIHVLIGFSGSGKSVTLKHALGLMPPDAGEIFILGQNFLALEGKALYDLRKNFGVLFQGSALFDSLNVFENIAFPLREHRKEMSESQISARVSELLEQVGLAGAMEKMPSQLSGGMQKRVGLARAIALEPKILLFDEPTTGLDPVTSQIIDDLIVSTTRKIRASAFIISHDIHAALRLADFVSMIWKGKIVDTGTPEQIVRTNHPELKHFLQSAGVGEK